MTREETIALFTENAAKFAAEPVRVRTHEELNRVLGEIVPRHDAIFCPAVTEKEAAVGIPAECRTEDYLKASLCIEEVFGAIAETGSLICSSGDGKPLQAGLLSAHHVAIVPAENIYGSLDDFLATRGDSPPTNMTLETGPSRTADIELTLTIGVHGPARLTIIVL